MRATRILVLALLAALAVCPGAGAQTSWTTTLSGAGEVPPVSTYASGNFDATLSADHTMMTFTLTYQGLKGSATQARIHRGAAGTTGPVLYYLSSGAFTSPLVGETDPAPAGGVPGFLPADYADLQAGNLYLNLISTAYPSGEIRGQIVSAVQASNESWGRIKALFR
jgi:hypothetical protein